MEPRLQGRDEETVIFFPLICVSEVALSEQKKGGYPPQWIAPSYVSSPGQTRTADLVINSHPLYRLSYRGT